MEITDDDRRNTVLAALRDAVELLDALEEPTRHDHEVSAAAAHLELLYRRALEVRPVAVSEDPAHHPRDDDG